ncbi:MAG: LPS-assembly protein LptD, partial [Archangium sp.]
SFTPCDCNLLEPSWRISSGTARVKPGVRASFTTPTVRVYGVPVFWMPWFSLPLTNRESGLLMPELTFSGLSGFQVDEPLFLTLGRSYDLTLSPGYAFGQKDPAGKGSLGVRGPRLAAEFRYAPSAQTQGRLWLRLLDDLKLERSPLDPNVLAPDAKQRGLRGWGIFEHKQDLGHDVHARADVTLYSDGFLFADTTTASGLARSYYYVPSTATLYHRGADDYEGLALAYRQDLRWGYPLFREAPRPPVFQKLPTLLYAVPTVPLLGPLTGDVRVELSRLSPLEGRLGDEGTDGVYWPPLPDPDGTQGNGRFDPGERQARTRLDVMPRLNATFDVGGALRVTPYLALREDAYLYEVTHEARNRAYGMAGLFLDTELSRVFGTGPNAVRHVLMPSVELRAVPRVFGQRAPPVYDEVDAAVTPSGFFQGLVALRQKVLVRTGTTTRELGRFDVTQGVDFLERRLGETSGRLLAALGPVTAEATGRLDLFTPQLQERLTQLSARARWNILPEVGVTAGYERTRGSSEQVRRPIDMLLPPPLPPPTPVSGGGSCSNDDLAKKPFDRVLLGGEAHFKFGLGVLYDAEVYRRDPAGCDVLRMNAQRLTLSYSPSCNCWRIDAYARLLPAPAKFDYGMTVTLANFGSFGH